jgi:glutamyl-tRNA synthetase
MRITRFAPSPTGDLHVGGAWTALASWAFARAAGGRTVLRVEDIDTPRVVAGSAERILEDLAWLGLDWDEGPIVQSARIAVYEAALLRLDAAGLTYPCDCSRAEIVRIASAPHAGEEGREAVYPGTCRDADPARTFKRPPAIRLRVPQGSRVSFDDALRGHVDEDVAREAGDFVLRRGDDVFAYQLVVAIDDAEIGASHVVRADDLLPSTGRQILLMQLLGYPAIPTYIHVPLVVSPAGERLAKRARVSSIRELSARGISAHTIIGALARGLGLVDETPDVVEPGCARPISPAEVARALTAPATWRTTPWPLPSAWT